MPSFELTTNVKVRSEASNLHHGCIRTIIIVPGCGSEGVLFGFEQGSSLDSSVKVTRLINGVGGNRRVGVGVGPGGY